MKKTISKPVQISSLNEPISRKDIDEIKYSLIEIKSLIKDFKRNLKGLVEIQQRLVHERLGVPVPQAPKEYGEEPVSKAKINIVSLDSDRIRVSGNTFDYKSAIKEAGISKWEQATKSWSGPLENLDQLIKSLEAVNLVKDVDFIVDVADTDNSKPVESDEDEGFGSGFQKDSVDF